MVKIQTPYISFHYIYIHILWKMILVGVVYLTVYVIIPTLFLYFLLFCYVLLHFNIIYYLCIIESSDWL